jgi:hypothetical protein
MRFYVDGEVFTVTARGMHVPSSLGDCYATEPGSVDFATTDTTPGRPVGLVSWQ